MFNKRSSLYSILILIATLISLLIFYWNDINLVVVSLTYFFGTAGIWIAVLYWDNTNLEKLILNMARDMTFSFDGDGPVGLVEGVIPDGSHAHEDSVVLTNVLRGYSADVNLVVVNVEVSESRIRVATSIKMIESLPPFRLRPKGREGADQFQIELSKEVNIPFSDGRPVEFPEEPMFSEMYDLEAVNESQIRHLFSPLVLKFFTISPNLAIDGGSWLVVTTALIETPREFRRWLQQTSDVYNLLSGAHSQPLCISLNHTTRCTQHEALVSA